MGEPVALRAKHLPVQVVALQMDQFAVIQHHAVHVPRAVSQRGHAVSVRTDRGDALVQRV
ncbi:hypothetical protein D3C87_1437270 [compost metagenome]